MIMIPRGPFPIVTIGIARLLPFAWKGEYVRRAAPWLEATVRSTVAINWS
jgi:hypothetical protein